MSGFDTLYKQILCENTGLFNVGIFPGAFKPPHKGHFSTALNACMQNDVIWLFVSDKSRIVEQPKHDTGGSSGSCDSDRYANFFNDKGAAVRERLGGLQRGDCERHPHGVPFGQQDDGERAHGNRIRHPSEAQDDEQETATADQGGEVHDNGRHLA